MHKFPKLKLGVQSGKFVVMFACGGRGRHGACKK